MESGRKRTGGARGEEETSQIGVGSHVQVGTRKTGCGEGMGCEERRFHCVQLNPAITVTPVIEIRLKPMLS